MTDQMVPAASSEDVAGVRVEITSPGVYDLPAEQYHADPVPGGSLSSTGARMLLKCPAKFNWARHNPQPVKAEFEFGTAAHTLLLGTGPELVEVEETEWRTNAVKVKVAGIRDRGGVPIKSAALETVHDMRDALSAHPKAGKLFTPGTGLAEQSLFWQDPMTGVQCRARLDWVQTGAGGRVVMVDYKSARSAELNAIEKSIYDYGYHIQCAFYEHGIRTLGLAESVQPVLVFQEKEPPYVVTVVEVSLDAMKIARGKVAQALMTYQRCDQSDYWPGYSDDIEIAGIPAWAQKREQGQ